MNKQETPFRSWVMRTFSERLMTELALLLIPATILPLLFPFSRVSLVIFDVINILIVVIFALEYFLKLIVSKPRWKYAIEPWHILDLLIVLLAALDFLPILPVKGWRASPLLRLLRLLRVFALTGRIVKRVSPADVVDGAPRPAGSGMRFDISSETGVRKDALLETAKEAHDSPGATWIDIRGISDADMEGLSSLMAIPVHILESKLAQDNFPGLDDFPGYSIIALWDSKFEECSDSAAVPIITNSPIIAVFTGTDIVSLSKGDSPFKDSPLQAGHELPRELFSIRILYSLLKRKMGDYKEIFSRLERTVAALEDSSSDHKPPKFLDTVFHLKKIIQKQGYNTAHLVRLFDGLLKDSNVLRGASEESRASFIALRSEAKALDDLCLTIRDNADSLIELQLNKVSFDINRVMKILAVITCLAVVPTIIGGLLGQNLKDQPYNITIHEIFFFVISLMLIGLYIFYRKGWLK